MEDDDEGGLIDLFNFERREPEVRIGMMLISANEFRVDLRAPRRDRSVPTQEMEVIPSRGSGDSRIKERRQVELFFDDLNLWDDIG